MFKIFWDFSWGNFWIWFYREVLVERIGKYLYRVLGGNLYFGYFGKVYMRA